MKLYVPWLSCLLLIGAMLAAVAEDGVHQKQGKKSRPAPPPPTGPYTPQATPVAQIKVAKGFHVELLYTVPKDTQGSWVAMTVDPQGRLIVSDEYGKLYRVALPAPGEKVELGPEPIEVELGQAQGLLHAFDSLYVMVSNDAFEGRGLYRVRDTDGDDQYDEVRLLRKLENGGEHGPHAVLLSPDRQSLHVVVGNQTTLTKLDDSRVPLP